MSRSFKAAVAASQSLHRAAEHSSDPLVAQQAQIISRLVKNLAQLERGLDNQGRQLTVLLDKLGRQSRRPQKTFGGGGRSGGGRTGGNGGRAAVDSGYYVDMVGHAERRPMFRAADTGLVGRRIGRGPVRMATATGGASTRALSAAFGRLLAAQTQLQQLRAEMDRIRQRR